MILDTLITDRTQHDVDRLKALLKLNWQDMTQSQKDEYIGGATPLQDINEEDLYDSQNEQLYALGGVPKGAYNYTDLNRVEEAVDYVADELVQAVSDLHDYATSYGVAWDSYFDMPYDPDDYTGLTIKTDWAVGDIPSATQMARYHNNLFLIQSALTVYTSIPLSMNNLTYSGANDIEQMLKEAHDALQAEILVKQAQIRSAAESYKSGEFYSGEVY